MTVHIGLPTGTGSPARPAPSTRSLVPTALVVTAFVAVWWLATTVLGGHSRLLHGFASNGTAHPSQSNASARPFHVPLFHMTL